MKKQVLIFTIIFITKILNGHAQNSNPFNNYKDYIENEQFISENKLDAHASFTSLPRSNMHYHSTLKMHIFINL